MQIPFVKPDEPLLRPVDNAKAYNINPGGVTLI